jgi:hypothetical protein
MADPTSQPSPAGGLRSALELPEPPEGWLRSNEHYSAAWRAGYAAGAGFKWKPKRDDCLLLAPCGRPDCRCSQPMTLDGAFKQYTGGLRTAHLDAETEQMLREYLWFGHGHIGLYGDDGEMQCGRCHPVWDYKRAPLADVVRQAISARRQVNIEALIEAQRSALLPVVQVTPQEETEHKPKADV